MAVLEITVTGVAYTIQYPDELEGVLTLELARSYNYQEFVPNPEAANDRTKPPMIPNPVPHLDFVVERVVGDILERVKQRDRQAAVSQATTAASSQVDTKYTAIQQQISVTKAP